MRETGAVTRPNGKGAPPFAHTRHQHTARRGRTRRRETSDTGAASRHGSLGERPAQAIRRPASQVRRQPQGGRFPDMPASALRGTHDTSPATAGAAPTARRRVLAATSTARKANGLPVQGDRVHPPPSSSAPPYLRHLAMAARRRDGTGWRSLRLSPHRAEWAGRAALHPRAGRDDLLFPPPQLRTPGRGPTVPRPGRTPPSPMRPLRGGDPAAALRAPLRARGEMLISREENCDRNGFGHNSK